MQKQKIVITGGAGFIGSNLAEYWINQNAEVHIIDNLRSGFLDNINQLHGIIFHQGSITDRNLVFDVLKNAQYVFNLAAMVSVTESILKPAECIEINVNGILNILGAAKEFGIKKVVHSSSAAVYGDNPKSPKTTEMKPEPKSPYGITKLDGEYYLKMYNEIFGLGTTSLRYFNVFGPKQDPKSQYSAAIPIFVDKAMKNETITIYGDGEQTRDFIFIKDVVNANVLAAQAENVNSVFNVATERATSINQIVRLVLNETNSKSKIVYEKERPGDIKHSLASIKETTELLNFKPSYNLETGLKETINYFVKRRNNF